ncbi:MAG: host attachment protein [Oceanicoccus sp.]
MSILVIVADGSRARFFSAVDKTAALIETTDLVNTGSRLRDQQLVTDGHGSGTDSVGRGKHTMGHEDDAHKHQASQFSRQLTDEIEKVRSAGTLRRIYIIAPPAFLGLIRSDLSKASGKLVEDTINKDLVNHDIADIRTHLPKLL